jgi:hypothetical protein
LSVVPLDNAQYGKPPAVVPPATEAKVCPEGEVVDLLAVRDIGFLLLLALLYVGVLATLNATRRRPGR